MKHSTPIILFVDQDLSASRSLRMELRRRGARVRMATTVAEADEWIGKEIPGLIILDGALGDEDLAAHFRDRCPDAEMILLDSKPSMTPHGVGLGLLFCGMKPVSRATLLEVIQSAFPGQLEGVPPETPRPGMVLCVDDDPEYLRSLSRTLSRHGYRVFPCEDSTRALDVMEKAKPDLAILDIMMPGIDGYDLADRIRARSGGSLPVVFLTALGSDEACYRGHEQGARYFLTKPCEPAKVLDVVDYFAGALDEDERELLTKKL